MILIWLAKLLAFTNILIIFDYSGTIASIHSIDLIKLLSIISIKFDLVKQLIYELTIDPFMLHEVVWVDFNRSLLPSVCYWFEQHFTMIVKQNFILCSKLIIMLILYDYGTYDNAIHKVQNTFIHLVTYVYLHKDGNNVYCVFSICAFIRLMWKIEISLL